MCDLFSSQHAGRTGYSLCLSNCLLCAGFHYASHFSFSNWTCSTLSTFFLHHFSWFSLLYSEFYQFISANCSAQNWTQDFFFGSCKISVEGFAISTFWTFLSVFQSLHDAALFPTRPHHPPSWLCPLPSLPNPPPCHLGHAREQLNPNFSSVSQAEQTQLPKPLLLCYMLQSQYHHCGFPLASLSLPLYWGSPNCTPYCQRGCTRGE